MSVDLDIMRTVAEHRIPAVTTVTRWAMDYVTNTRAVLLTALAASIVVIARRWWWQGPALGVAVVAARESAKLLKLFIARPRPPADLAVATAGSSAMPSTVGAMTAALAVVAYLVIEWPASRRRTVAAVLIAAVVLVGIGMVYLGAHWPTDVLAGWCLGIGVGAAVAVSTRKLREIRPVAAGDR